MGGFNRILLKLSGEALMGDGQFGIDPETVAAIAKEVKVSKSSVERIVKTAQPKPVEPTGPQEARILKPFPNPRIMAIYFGERKDENYGKCVVKPFLNYPPNAKINVLPVEGEDGLYRIA